MSQDFFPLSLSVFFFGLTENSLFFFCFFFFMREIKTSTQQIQPNNKNNVWEINQQVNNELEYAHARNWRLGNIVLALVMYILATFYFDCQQRGLIQILQRKGPT